MPESPLAQSLKLPCGAVLPNRLAKAAMTEGLADDQLHATHRHETLYRRWSEGGAGLLITGNVMIDHRVLERPGNVAIDPAPAEGEPEGMAQLRAWAEAGTRNGNHLWMQISHAGRQSPRYVTTRPMGPSAVQLSLMGNYARHGRSQSRRSSILSSALPTWPGLRKRRVSPAFRSMGLMGICCRLFCRRSPTSAPIAGVGRWKIAPVSCLRWCGRRALRWGRSFRWR